MTRFWVVGGDDRECRFGESVGSRERWSGPFETYADAEQEWDRLCKAENCAHSARFRIERLDPDSPPPATD